MRFCICVFAPLFCLVSPVPATTYTVLPEGGGDFPSIQTAVEAAVDGDVIELGNGTFAGEGNRDIDYLGKAITIQSQNGDPGLCTIYCEGSQADPHRGFMFQSGEDINSKLAGVTILEAWAVAPDGGSGVYCGEHCSPTIISCVFWSNVGMAIKCEAGSWLNISDCLFSYNQASYGGAINADRCNLTVTNCEFVKNSATDRAGAIYGYGVLATISGCTFSQHTAYLAAAVYFSDGSSVDVLDCSFDSNASETQGAALTFWLSGPNVVESCTFTGNVANSEGAAIWSEKVSDTTVRYCTFYGNNSPDGSVLAGHHSLVMENCIAAFNLVGPGVASHQGYAELSCCDIFGNEGGDWVGTIADQYGINGNISEDPLFCAPWEGDFHLDTNSPCARENNPECGQIGAWPIGCGGTPVVTGSWGVLKMHYRKASSTE